MVAGELLFTYDPTPATWMYTWDSDIREDAPLAISAGVIIRSVKTTQDAAIGIQEDGRSTFPFEGGTPARDLWEVHARIVSKPRPGFGFVSNLYGGTGEPNGADERLVHRYGVDLRVISGSLKWATAAKFNDWGPYDYHRDGNITYPVQLVSDLSKSVGIPPWFQVPDTRLGVMATWRSLDQYSNRYTGTASTPNGNEWEIRTYLHLFVGM
jgi:hypothetical protein